MATQEVINVGTLPNDGLGDPLRTAYQKINNNFSNLFSTFVNTSNTYTVGNSSSQVIFQTSAEEFTTGEFVLYAIDTSSYDTQSTKLFAQVDYTNANVKFTAYGSTFFGNAVTSFDMNVVSGNVQILSNPITSNVVLYNIGSQNIWIGENVPGLAIEVDGYVDTVLTTENGLILTTE